MTIKEKVRAHRVIKQVAREEGREPAEVRQDMQAAIDAAWENQAGAELQLQLFPAGKPTVEEFLIRIRRELLFTPEIGRKTPTP